MTWTLILVLAVSTTLVTSSHTGATDVCPGPSGGANDREELLRFDSELRTALSAGDVASTALLVSFPLRVNDSGTIFLADARTFQARFAEVFPPSIRKAVLETEPEQVLCFWRYDSTMYGLGEVWVSRVRQGAFQRFAVVAVNVNAAPIPLSPQLDFVCNGDLYRAIIESNSDQSARLRTWEQPRLLTDVPDIDISGGEMRLEGSGSLTYRVWEFHDRDTKVVVTDGVDFESSPPGALGALFLSVIGEGDSESWCY